MKLAQLDFKYVVHRALKFLPRDDAVLVLIDLFHDVTPHLVFFGNFTLVPSIGAKFATQLILSNRTIAIGIENFKCGNDISFVQKCDFVASSSHKLLPSDSPIAIENFESSPDVSFIQQGDFVACGRHKFLPSDSTIAILVHLLHHSFVFIGRVLLAHHFLASQGLVHVL